MPRDLDFSFSGLKTAVRYTLPKVENLESEIPNLCASFQQAVIDVLVMKSIRAAQAAGCTLLTLSGGVSCNRTLRDALQAACDQSGIRFLACPPQHSTDNAAMIAFTALLKFQRGERSSFHDDIDPNLALIAPAES